MTLAEIAQAIRPAVVAFIPRAIPQSPGGVRPELFPIIGTGFVLVDGLLITNAHVLDALLKLPRPTDWPRDKGPFTAVPFHYSDKRDYPNVPMEVHAQI